MVAQLGRWRVSDVAGIPTTRIGASPGAFVRSPIADDAPSEVHTHIYLHQKPPPARTRVHDQARPSPRRRGRDQQRLVARLRQDGVSGSWEGEDGEGNPCTVEHGPDGLELYAAPEVEGDQTDPEIIPSAVPGGKSIDRLLRRAAPRQVNARTQPGRERDQLQALQSYLDTIWTPKS